MERSVGREKPVYETLGNHPGRDRMVVALRVVVEEVVRNEAVLIGFSDRLDVGCKRKREVKVIFKFDLSNN